MYKHFVFEAGKSGFGLSVLALALSSILNTSAFAAQHSLESLNAIHTPERSSITGAATRSLSRASADGAVHMDQGSFYLDPQFTPELTAQTGYVLLQLTGPLEDDWRTALERLGVTLLDYIPDNTWTSQISRDQLDAVQALAFVRAMGNIYPADKLPSQLIAHDLSPRSQLGDEILLEVAFNQDESYEHVLADLQAIDASPQQSGFSSGQRLMLTLPGDKLASLAALDSVRWIEEPTSPKADQNVDAAELSRVSSLRLRDPSLSGEGVTIAGWEGYVPQSDHQDLDGRVTIAQRSNTSNHATHIAGTIVSSGDNNPSARGMAPNADYVAYTSAGDIPRELRGAVRDYDIIISNHSWGYINGWSKDYYDDGYWTWFGGAHQETDADFGRYGSDSQQWDQFVAESNTIVIKSAGNNRNDMGALPGVAHRHYGDNRGLHYDYHRSDADYDSLDFVGSAKNVITVGAVDDIGRMTNYSGWGPTDDDRIKPDIVANGSTLYSTQAGNGYGSMSGTSMAAPTVSGSLALLVELYRRLYGEDPTPDTVKALMIQTAEDLGRQGPDYSYGWGLFNADAIAEVLEMDATSGLRLRRAELSSQEITRHDIDIPADADEIKVSIAWTDPAGSPHAATALVNDLDLRLIAPDGTVYYPFTLSGMSDPEAPARSDRPNRVDNVEQVRVVAPAAGRWQVEIEGHSVQGTQAYSLATSYDLWVDGKRRVVMEESVAEPIATDSGAGGGGVFSPFWLFALILPALRKSRAV